MNDNSMTSNDDLMIAVQNCIELCTIIIDMESANFKYDKETYDVIKKYAKSARECANDRINEILDYKTVCLRRGTYDTDKRSAQASDS